MKPYTHLALAHLIGTTAETAGVPVNRRGLLWGSVLPDLDFALMALYPRFLVHRTVTHSLFFISLSAYLMRRRHGFWSVWLGGLSHLLADEFNGCDSRRGHWPRQMWFFPFELALRRPMRRCLVDMGVIPGPHGLRDLIIEGPILLLALLSMLRKGKR